MIEDVQQTPGKMIAVLSGTDGTQRAPTLDWDARSYVCHVVDNFRIWAERLAGATAMPASSIATYDTDLLATARNYRAIPLSGALWSLADAVTSWCGAVDIARSVNVVLLHPERGSLRLLDVASTNAHDAYHHVYDVRRSGM
jgi:hypothetical protein